MLAEGRREFLAVPPRPAQVGILAVLKINFDYLECQFCSRLIETATLTPEAVHEWQLDKSILKPSILGVAHGTCPVCQELKQQFSKVFRS